MAVDYALLHKMRDKKITQEVFPIPFNRGEIFTMMYIIAEYNSLVDREPSLKGELNTFEIDSIVKRLGGYMQALTRDDPEMLDIAQQMHIKCYLEGEQK